jgi:hypothetical protein
MHGRRPGLLASAIVVAALMTSACGRPVSGPAGTPAKAEDFHHSDPKIIGATGRPQLLEFFGPT